MSADEYRALAQLYIDSINANDEEGMAAAFAEDFLDHNNAEVSGLPPGLQGVILAHRMLHESFPDLKFTLHQTLVDGDKVAIRVSARGTNTGAFYGIPATNKVITWNGLRILRVANGKFVEGVNQFDQLGILQQLGVIPS
jgi:predicted ester cyclase